MADLPGNLEQRLMEVLRGQVAQEYSIELKPDIRNPEETYLLAGDQAALKNNISLLMAFRQMIEQVGGNVLGFPYESYVWDNPAPLQIQIHWRLKKSPPWEPFGLIEDLHLNRASPPRPYCTLRVDARRLTWQAVKDAAGGDNGYVWGHHYAVARLGKYADQKLGKGGIIKIYAASEAAAVSRIEALMALSSERIFTITSGQERQDQGRRRDDAGFRKPVIRIYPAWFCIFNWKLVDQVRNITPTEGRSTGLGKIRRKNGKIPLWMPRATPEINALVTQLKSQTFS